MSWWNVSKANWSDVLLSQYVIKLVAFSFVVLFKRGRSLVIALSPSNVRWQLTKSDYLPVAPRVFCDVNGRNRIQTGFP